MSLYVILSSDNSKDYFPNNSPASFRSHLNIPLILNGMWRVAIVEANISTTISKTEALLVHSNICDDSIVNGYSKPLLRRLMSVDPGNWSIILDSPHYVPIKVSEIYNIDIFITDDQGDNVSFLDQSSTITLHFKAFPFF